MGLKTASVGYFTIPTAPAAGTSITSGSANAYSASYVQLIASTAAAIYIVGVMVELSSTSKPTYISVQLATGGAGSESIVSQLVLPVPSTSGATGTQVAAYIALPYPIPVANATRIAAKTADSVGSLAELVTLQCINQGNVVDDGTAMSANVTQWNGTNVASPATAGIPEVNVKNINNAAAATPGASGGILISGSNSGTTTLGALTITGATTHTGNVLLSDGLTIAAPSTTDRAGITITGNGAGAGISTTGGGTGQGIKVVGGGTSGDGIGITTTSGHAISAVATGTTKHGIHAAGGATTSHGINAVGGGVGHGILATSGGGSTGDGIRATAASSNGNGFNGVGVGTGAGILVTGGGTGHGIAAVGGATSGDGINSVATTSGHGLTVTGVGTTKHGVNATGGSTTSHGISATGGGVGHGILATSGTGSTGDGIRATAASSNGNGINALGVGTGAGVLVTGGATGIGFSVVGGATSGDGIKITTTSGHGIDVLPAGTAMDAIHAVGAAASGANAAGHAINATGGAASATAGGTAGIGFKATGGAGAAANNGAGEGFTIAGGGTTTVSGANGASFTGTGNLNGISLVLAGTGTGLLSEIKGNITGNLSGSVGSVTGAVGSVTGAVGSVTGNVGGNVVGSVASVTGNVGGNVVGSVASVTARVTANTDQWAGGTIPAPNVTGVPLVDLKYTLGTLSTGAAGYVGIDWGHVNAPSTSVNLSGTTVNLVNTVTTVTNQLTAAAIATGVWTDTTAGDFTTALSIGKSIMNGVSLGSALHISLVDTLTTYTGNTPQTGDSFARIGATGSGLTSLAPASTAVSNVDYTAARATKLDHLDADITSRMATYTQPTGFLAATFPSTVASPTNITAGTITTVTNLTNAPTSGDFTSTMKTSLNAATPASVTGAVGSVTGNVGGNVVGSVGSVVGLTASNLDAAISTRLASGSYTAPDNAGISAIRVQTDKLTFTVANQVDANIQYVNDVQVKGAGTPANPWGP